MGWFSSRPTVSTDEKAISDVLTRGVSEVVVKEQLEKKLRSGERLRIKLGIDPTSPDLHIGRAVPLLKLRDFQQLGHQIVLIVGDFTAVIGDTSDKDAERPMLSPEVIEKNKKSYFEQAGKILDLSQVEMRYNSEWLKKLTYREIGEHADLFSVADFIARDNIKRRLDAGKRVSLRELLYPLMQGYDSVAIQADVELGGTDQKFNVLAGRPLQEHFRQRPQDIVLNPLIDGLDGTKMSSSKGNVIALTASPSDMYGKVMSMGDAQVHTYFELCTRVPMHEVEEILKGHPKEAKQRLAKEIVMIYHSKDAAEKAAKDWVNTFSEGGVPEDIKETFVGSGVKYSEAISGSFQLSKSEVRRLIEGGAVSEVGGEVISNVNSVVTKDITLRIGKHRFLKITVKN
ncbi:MAG: tyrosine--tRNA ligase [Candidatus Pacebacteria bacterium]|nr:tyrosine--tRNA ligase [Candidatus Paceibacterota bacterium]